MKITRKASAFTLIELLVVISIIGILATLAVPAVNNALVKGQMTGTLNNARQLQIATQTMSLDSFNAGSGLEWTMKAPDGGGEPTAVGLTEYFDELTENNYLTKQDLRKLLSAPGKSPGDGTPSSGNIAFKIFAVQESSPADQPFVVTANWEAGGLTGSSPYGQKGFVVFNKGGSGGIYTRKTDATSDNIFPKTQDGVEYSYTPLQ